MNKKKTIGLFLILLSVIYMSNSVSASKNPFAGFFSRFTVGTKNKALFEACEKGDLEEVKRCVNNGANVDAKDDFGGYTPLHRACGRCNKDIIKYLVEECHADINAVGRDKQTSLYWACRPGNKDVVEWLIMHGADVNMKDFRDDTPLLWACVDGNKDIIKYLVEECHADVNVKDCLGTTPLHNACIRCNKDVLKYFVEKFNADVNAICRDGSTPLHKACLAGNKDAVVYLVEECHVDVNVKTADRVIPPREPHRCRFASKAAFARLVEESKANVRIVKGETPLQWAFQNGHKNIAEYLRTHGAE